MSDQERNGAASVGTSATAIATGMTTRKGLLVQNLGTTDVFVGDANVTTATGIKIPAGDSLPLGDFGGTLYGVCASGTNDVRWMGVS